MESISESRKKLTTELGRFNQNLLHDLRGALENFQAEVARMEKLPDQTEVIAYERGKLALLALELQQFTLPTLSEMADELIDVAGEAACRVVCSPSQSWTGVAIPSKFQLPVKFSGVASRAARTLAAAIAKI